MRRLTCAAAAAFTFLVLAAPSAAQTVYRGQWQCDDRGTVAPLAGIELQLWKRGTDWLPVEWSGRIDDRGHTAADGTFALTSSRDGDNYFVRMALRDRYGVRLKDFWGINDWSVDTHQLRNDRREHYMGGLRLSTPGQSHKCAIWQGLSKAHAEFRTETGMNPPSGGLLVQADAVTAGVPFTPHTEVWWPGGFPTGYSGGGDDSITRHEFGHVIRHGYDGDAGHFLGDVIHHNYLQMHENCNKTGLGFAFNEGWAEYWANDYAPAPNCPGRQPDDYEVEGNVAAALADLAARCFGGRRASMVAVLRANPGRIHSFQEFRDRVACPAPLSESPPPPAAPAEMPRVSAAAAASRARVHVQAARSLVVRLRRDLRRAKRANLPACASRGCEAAQRVAMRPAAIRTELRLTDLLRKSYDDADTAREQKKLAALPVAKLMKKLRAKERRNRKKAALISAKGIKSALKAHRKVFRRKKTSSAKRMRRQLAKRSRQFKRAAKKGRIPSTLILDQTVRERIERVAEESFPGPQPQPTPTPTSTPTPSPTATPDNRAPSTLTIDQCPASVGAPKPIDVGGKLTPAHQGTEIEVTYSFTGHQPVVKKTKTDIEGNWTSSHDAEQYYGSWTVKAAWPGDEDHLPSESGTCVVSYD